MGREAVLEVTGQTTPTRAPPSASGTPILSRVSTGHRNLATDPTINTQNQHDHTEQTSTRPLYNAANATANLISCMGELTHPTHNHTHSTSSSLYLGPQIPILSETASSCHAQGSMWERSKVTRHGERVLNVPCLNVPQYEPPSASTLSQVHQSQK